MNSFITFVLYVKNMLVGGADVSGDKHREGEKREGERNYISFIVGTEERVNKIYNDIGINGIHMSELTESQREHVRRNMNFNSNDIRVWCFHVQRQHIEEYILHHPRLKNYKKPKILIHKNFDHHLLNSIKNQLQDFVFSYKQEFSDVVIHTDDDMKDTIEHWKMKRKVKGISYELSDAVAWFNQKHVDIDSCNHMDLRSDIRSSMERDLLE